MKKIYLNKCEVCGSKSIKLFQKYGRIGSNFNYGILKIFICLNCNHRFQNPRLPDQFYVNYYLNKYRKKENNNILIDRKYLKSQELRGVKVYDYLIKFFKKKIQKKRILDHGSALGHVMLKFKKKGWDCIGIDPNIESINSKYKIKNIKIDNYFGENLPKYKMGFDLVISLGSLEHAYDLSLTLKNIRKNLTYGGILFIRWRSENLMGSPLEYFNFNHLRYFSNKSLKNVLYRNGFEIIKITNESIELNNGYTYYVCRKVKIKQKLFKKRYSNINTQEFYNNYNLYLSRYYELCKKIKALKIENKLENVEQKKKFIKKYKIGLLSKENSSIDRYINESQRYLKFLKKFNLTNKNI